jgi:type IV secretory pathway VirB10-like protein
MKKVILLILCLFPATLFAQSATDYFHKSANFYVNANKKSAQTTIREGIEKFPDNQKLKDLAAKIEELPDPEEDKNKQDQQNQDNQDQQEQEQDQNQQQQEQDQKKDEMQQKQQQQQEQISREDAQRILDAIAQEEKELQEKLQKKEPVRSRRIEKNW